jgi:hypothetical protein
VTDQSSTHGTFVNGEKCTPFEPKRVQNGDVIKLGTTLEYTSHTTEKHLPTELELGIVEIDSPIANFPPTMPVLPTTNSFHAPVDSDSDSDYSDGPIFLPKLVLKPFATALQPPLLERSQGFDREGSSAVTSVNGLGGEVAPSQPAQLPAMIDLTEETPYVAVEPVHMQCISLVSDDEREEEREEEEEEYTGHGDYAFPYEYDTEDKESVNGEEFQVPETQIFTTMANPPINVPPLSPLFALGFLLAEADL